MQPPELHDGMWNVVMAVNVLEQEGGSEHCVAFPDRKYKEPSFYNLLNYLLLNTPLLQVCCRVHSEYLVIFKGNRT